MRCALLLLLLCPIPAHLPALAAQDVDPYVGVGGGFGGLPESLSSCGGSSPALVGDARAGLAGPRLRLEGRGVVRFGTVRCHYVDDFLAPPDGVHTTRNDEVEEGAEFASELHLHFRPAASLPLFAGVGAGWEWISGFPFVVAGAGIQTRGRVGGTLALEHRWAAIPYWLHTAEWADGRIVRTLEERTLHRWERAAEVRLGVVLRVR